MVFTDREQAARRLISSGRLERFRSERPLILGVPRGAVPMAWTIARHLGAPLDVVLVHKFGLESNPEYALGAVSEDGDIHFGEGARRSGLGEKELEGAARRQIERLQVRRRLLTPHRRPLSVKGRTVIVVDDGIATGATMMAAVRFLRDKGARHIVVAVPVATGEAVQRLESESAEVVTLSVPENFFSVSQFYEDFPQVTDQEVVEVLKEATSPEVVIREGDVELKALLRVPDGARGLVVFAHGSGSGRRSPRNQFVAKVLLDAGFATLLADLLSETESENRERVFDIDLLTQRLQILARWSKGQEDLKALPLSFFGASTGAAAALQAAAEMGSSVAAVVSRGGRPDLAWESLGSVRSPTLLIVGGDDEPVVALNRRAFDELKSEKRIEIVEGASHLFEEPGALEQVADLARSWLEDHVVGGKTREQREQTSTSPV